jgi:hypothetical protein
MFFAGKKIGDEIPSLAAAIEYVKKIKIFSGFEIDYKDVFEIRGKKIPILILSEVEHDEAKKSDKSKTKILIFLENTPVVISSDLFTRPVRPEVEFFNSRQCSEYQAVFLDGRKKRPLIIYHSCEAIQTEVHEFMILDEVFSGGIRIFQLKTEQVLTMMERGNRYVSISYGRLSQLRNCTGT